MSRYGLALLLALTSTGALAGLEIDRVWEDHGTAYSLVSFSNDSGRTFESLVTVQCVALDRSGRKLNMNQRSFFAHEVGPIEPGFEGTLKIPVRLEGGAFDRMSCRVLQAR